MLELKNISKQYRTGDEVQTTLDQVSLTFSNREFVSILGQVVAGRRPCSILGLPNCSTILGGRQMALPLPLPM